MNQQTTTQEMKSIRLLSLFERLQKGELVNKKLDAHSFHVNEKTIQRDLEEIRLYLHEQMPETTLVYDRKKKSYILSHETSHWLTKEEILALTKVLIETRAFPLEEMNQILNKIILHAEPNSRAFIKDVIRNERFHYVPLQHQKSLLTLIWDISDAIRTHKVITISYQKENQTSEQTRTLQPVGLLFSDYYFYLAAHLVDYDFPYPTIFRVDRITDYKITSEPFTVDYKNRFSEGEFRQRIQFMNSGPLMKVTFRFTGPSLQAMLDRLPTAKVIKQDENSAILEAEVFGNGLKMWLLGQGTYVEVLKPESFREEMKATIEKTLQQYL